MQSDVLQSSDFLSLRLQYQNERIQGELPAAIEHAFVQGTMVDHYFITVAPAVLAVPEIAALGDVCGLLFVQQENGPWLVYFHEITMTKEVCVEMPEDAFRAMLAANGVTLPGE